MILEDFVKKHGAIFWGTDEILEACSHWHDALDAGVIIGEYTLSVCEHGGFFLRKSCGEGFQVSTDKLEALLKEFYEREF